MIPEKLAREVCAAPGQLRSFTRTIPTVNFQVTVRRAARLSGEWEHARHEPSGGVVVTVETPDPAYGKGVRQTARLGPGWTEQQLAQRIRSLLAEVSRQYPLELVALREQVYHRTTTVVDQRVTSKLSDQQQAEVERLVNEGHQSDYTLMNEDDCRFWLAWCDAQGLSA